MKVKIKKIHPEAIIPTYAKEGDAGLDLTAVSYEFDKDGNSVYHTGLAFEIPKGYVGLVFPRSSLSKKDISLANSVGVIDSGYRGEVTLKFKSHFRFINPFLLWWKVFVLKQDRPYRLSCTNTFSNVYEVGDRVGQMIIMKYPHIEFEEVAELSETERGTGGYGSSGK